MVLKLLHTLGTLHFNSISIISLKYRNLEPNDGGIDLKVLPIVRDYVIETSPHFKRARYIICLLNGAFFGLPFPQPHTNESFPLGKAFKTR